MKTPEFDKGSGFYAAAIVFGILVTASIERHNCLWIDWTAYLFGAAWCPYILRFAFRQKCTQFIITAFTIIILCGAILCVATFNRYAIAFD